ncbi:aminodeoxychorismate synthase component I [Marinospirillum insulare]|uniref:aminodeoxychorismate synthase n=1 Tax=Marinospirillum insulare TaxID=217169 RepID=A0ABQ5ZVY5_9GAMM|nr:aminodeoxychorismate synthase component I [Marinospirillum insulare]GLR63195.1 aminodeoxychorismate synthase component I [Marinospirillum insulare]
MGSLQAFPLPLATATELLLAIKHLTWPCLLDSGLNNGLKSSAPTTSAGRFSIAVADPSQQLEISNPAQVKTLELIRPTDKTCLNDSNLNHLPFIGGWLGYWSYDAGRLFEDLPQEASQDIHLPLIRMGYYQWALVTDHQLEQTWLVGEVSQHLATEIATRLKSIQAEAVTNQPESFKLTQPFVSNLSYAGYQKRFNQVQDLLRSGDTYQVNLAQRFTASYQGDIYQAWHSLRQQIAAPFSAFMDFGDATILSLSPERFLQASATGLVETKPIKGTRPRGKTQQEDQQLAEELLNSKKDQAENLMIVDLLRNDLGRVCQPGSIQVPDLFTLESYTNVHHLVSRITGQLAKGKDNLDLLKASFPGGSITGAPKLRAMQIIDQLEPSQRSVYCGSIGYLDRRGGMDFNIAIRTFIAHQGQLHISAGGGLVADSNGSQEYQETLDKVARLIRCLEPGFTGKPNN